VKDRSKAAGGPGGADDTAPERQHAHRPCRVLAAVLAASARCTVGGQAVMEGVMMRNKDRLAIAVRRPDGTIVVENRPWFTLTGNDFLKRPFVRGFPILIETLVNGIKALNYSATQAVDEEVEGELKPWHLAATLAASIMLALGLFVVLPHLFSMGMNLLGLGGDADGLSFHVWDGIFKFGIFLAYILGISFIPDIRRVFQYHGAEHKVIWTYEDGNPVTTGSASLRSRLHPRCGTTFLLFVLSIAIILHTVLVPALLLVWKPEGTLFKHSMIILFKLALMAPISAIAYEAIKYSARVNETIWGRVLSAPGMLLQMLTTHEPDTPQLEVAIVALKEALGTEATEEVHAPAYTVSEKN